MKKSFFENVNFFISKDKCNTNVTKNHKRRNYRIKTKKCDKKQQKDKKQQPCKNKDKKQNGNINNEHIENKKIVDF